MDDNIKTPQDALEWLDRSIREEAELDGEMSNAHAIQLGFIQNMLAKFPRRNCDVGTPEEQFERWIAFCGRYDDDCTGCPYDVETDVSFTNCFANWAQMPYAQEGGAK